MVKDFKVKILKRIDILIVIIFLVLPFIFFKDSINLNSVIFGMRDAEQAFLPYHYLKLNLLKNFELPIWNQYIFNGFPLFSNPSAYVLYPVTLVLGLLFPATVSFNLSVLIHYSLAGIFIYLFLREYKLTRIACFTAGLIFMFSGFMITHRDHITMLYTIVWFPLILLFLEKYRKSKRVEFIFLSSIFYSFSFFGGNPQMFLYGSIVILFFILFYSFLYNGIQKYFIFSLSIFLFVLLLISIQLIPSYILMKNSIRDAISYTFFSDFSFSPKLLPVLFFPFIFGSGSHVIQGVPKYFGPWNSGEMLIYFGISTIPFLIFGFFKKNKHKFFWIFVLFLYFILVFGRYNPLYRILYYIPLLNKFRIPARHWFEFGMAFSILAGFGFDYFISLSSKKTRKIIISIVVFLTIVITSFFMFYLAVNSGLKEKLLNFFINDTDKAKYFLQNFNLVNYSIYIPLIIIIVTIAIFVVALFKKNKVIYFLLVLLIFFDLFSFGHFLDRNRDSSYIYNELEASDELKFLKEEEELFRVFPITYKTSGYRLYANMNIYYGINIIDGLDAMQLEDYGSITSIRNDPGWGIDWKKLLQNNNIISMLNTKYIIAPYPENISDFMHNIEEDDHLDNIEQGYGQDNYKIVYSNDNILILENQNFIPRFYFVKNVQEVDNVEQVKKILWKEDVIWDGNKFNPQDTALVERIDFDKRKFDNTSTEINIADYRNNSIVLEVKSESDVFMVFSDTYYPGWKSYIDDKETKIYRTNGILKGIYIPKGSHTIKFNYLPPYFLPSSIISFSTFVLIILGTILIILKRKKKEKSFK